MIYIKKGMCVYIFMSLNEEYGQSPKHLKDLHDLLMTYLLSSPWNCKLKLFIPVYIQAQNSHQPKQVGTKINHKKTAGNSTSPCHTEKRLTVIHDIFISLSRMALLALLLQSIFLPRNHLCSCFSERIPELQMTHFGSCI